MSSEVVCHVHIIHTRPEVSRRLSTGRPDIGATGSYVQSILRGVDVGRLQPQRPTHPLRMPRPPPAVQRGFRPPAIHHGKKPPGLHSRPCSSQPLPATPQQLLLGWSPVMVSIRVDGGVICVFCPFSRACSRIFCLHLPRHGLGISLTGGLWAYGVSPARQAQQ